LPIQPIGEVIFATRLASFLVFYEIHGIS